MAAAIRLALQTNSFQLLGIPGILFFVAFIAKGIASAPRIQSGHLPEREAFIVGLELSVVALGIYWKAWYTLPPIREPFPFIASLALLMCCALMRNRLHRRPWVDFFATNILGVINLGFVILMLVALPLVAT